MSTVLSVNLYVEHMSGITDPANMSMNEARPGLSVWDILGSVGTRQAGEHGSFLNQEVKVRLQLIVVCCCFIF